METFSGGLRLAVLSRWQRKGPLAVIALAGLSEVGEERLWNFDLPGVAKRAMRMVMGMSGMVKARSH